MFNLQFNSQIQIGTANENQNTNTSIMVLSWMHSGDWHGREELLNKVIILVFSVHKKYFRYFITLQLNL